MAKENLLPGVHLGVSPLSWTNDVLAELGGDIPLETCLKDAADIGYEGVELGRKFPREGRQLSSILSSYGLRLSGWLAFRVPRRTFSRRGMEGRRGSCPITEGLRQPGIRLRRMGLITDASPWDEPLSKRPT